MEPGAYEWNVVTQVDGVEQRRLETGVVRFVLPSGRWIEVEERDGALRLHGEGQLQVRAEFRNTLAVDVLA